MNAPEKLYFPEDGLPRYIDWDGSPIRTKQVEDSDICYISKDALREWLEMKTETAEIMVANSVDRWVTRQVYKQVLNKLESM